MDERPVLTLHLPIQVDQIARLAEVLEELWPDCRFRPLPSGDLLVITAAATEGPRNCGAHGLVYECTLPAGHKGAHAAFDDTSRLLSAWGYDHG